METGPPMTAPPPIVRTNQRVGIQALDGPRWREASGHDGWHNASDDQDRSEGGLVEEVSALIGEIEFWASGHGERGRSSPLAKPSARRTRKKQCRTFPVILSHAHARRPRLVFRDLPCGSIYARRT